jgi:hypothetical protein
VSTSIPSLDRLVGVDRYGYVAGVTAHEERAELPMPCIFPLLEKYGAVIPDVTVELLTTAFKRFAEKEFQPKVSFVLLPKTPAALMIRLPNEFEEVAEE